MNALADQPQNLNQLSQLNFKMMIRRTPTTSYFCYAVNLPGISLPPTNQPTAFINIPQPGDHVEFNPLVATFKVDENLTNYFDIHSWMRKLGRADDFREYAQLASKQQSTGLAQKSEIVVAYLDSQRNPSIMVTYYDAHPIQLTDINFNSQNPDLSTASATVVFKYLNYDFEFIKTNTTYPENWLTNNS